MYLLALQGDSAALEQLMAEASPTDVQVALTKTHQARPTWMRCGQEAQPDDNRRVNCRHFLLSCKYQTRAVATPSRSLLRP